jgi:cytochrome c
MFRFCSLTLMILFGALVLSASPANAQGDGAKVYAAQKCTMCHSIAGVGNKKLPLDGVGTKLSADQIKEWIVTPVEAAKKANSTAKPAMKAYPALAKADLDALVGYMKSLTK